MPTGHAGLPQQGHTVEAPTMPDTAKIFKNSVNLFTILNASRPPARPYPQNTPKDSCRTNINDAQRDYADEHDFALDADGDEHGQDYVLGEIVDRIVSRRACRYGLFFYRHQRHEQYQQSLPQYAYHA